jgi:multisubunit Na+/H+ antiporter MnhE subunit
MDTMKIYLTAIAADTKNTAQVNFDTVSTFDDSETTTTVTTLNRIGSTAVSATLNDATVLKMTPAVANTTASNAVTATKGKRAFASLLKGNTQFVINGVSVPATAYAMTGNGAVDALNIASQANKDLAAAAGLTMDAVNAYASGVTVALNAYANNATDTVDERYTKAAVTTASTDTGSLWTVGIEDEFTLTVGSNSVTTTPGSVSGNATDLAGLEAMIIAAWGAKYGASGTASTSAIATIVADGVAGSFFIQSLQKDSGGNGLAVSFGIADKAQATADATATQTSANIGWKIGATTASTDNSTIATTTGAGVIVTFESTLTGVTDSVLTGMTSVITSVPTSMLELTTSYAASTGVTTYALTQANRTDVRNVAVAVTNSAVSNAVAAVKFNRVTWLG